MSDSTTTELTPQETAAPTTSEPTMPPAPAITSADTVSRDVAMTDAVEPSSVGPSATLQADSEVALTRFSQSPAPNPQAAPSAPSPASGRTGTPSRNLNGEASSRAGSVHPDAHPTNIPNQAVEHGDPARMYLNNNVTAVLLEGMKIIGKNQPKNPLKVLGEFLLEESRKRNEPSG
ncbi:putative dpy-30 domain-containing protein [Colletotrichum sublineola]|uniref:Putative dpy-30 domain-containing protein n=1 Tax=Colletotrichum sublineola TaxID=1173701 RepID=A0A066XBY9_COLSU|nr:putative dpy-30 domain-containing protein [Colletotrichum sublineola]